MQYDSHLICLNDNTEYCQTCCFYFHAADHCQVTWAWWWSFQATWDHCQTLQDPVYRTVICLFTPYLSTFTNTQSTHCSYPWTNSLELYGWLHSNAYLYNVLHCNVANRSICYENICLSVCHSLSHANSSVYCNVLFSVTTQQSSV